MKLVVISLAIAVLLVLALLSVKESDSSRSPSQKRSWTIEKVPGRSTNGADIEFVSFDFEQFAMSCNRIHSSMAPVTSIVPTQPIISLPSYP